MKQTKVLLVDDHARVRAGIRRLLDNQPDIIVIGEAEDGEEALKMVDELAPDIILLDVEMPRMNGHQVAQQLRERNSHVRVLALSAYDDRHYIEGMLESGAAGYLTKDEVPEVLVEALRGVARGEDGWFSKRVERTLGSQ